MNKHTFPIRYFFSIKVPVKLPRIVFPPTIIQQMDVRMNFVQPLDLQCLPTISADCVVEDVSRHLDIPTLDFF